MAVGGGGDRQDGCIDVRLFRWEDTVANLILGTEPNVYLEYAPGLKPHYPIMSMIGENRGQLEIYIERDDHVVKDPKDNYEILLWGFGFDCFDEDDGGGDNG